MPLIVIHRDHPVIVPIVGFEVCGIRRERPVDCPAFLAALLYCRPDGEVVLLTEQSVLAGVRVQTRHSELW